jgi:hypothetical protein
VSEHSGGCHCGKVRFRVRAELRGLTFCNCSICAKKGYIHWIVPRAAFELERGEGELSTYSFNTGIAKHLFCRSCGIHSFYVPRSDPDKIDVNARCLDGIDVSELAVESFDGRHWEEAITGRKPWRDD